MRRFALFFAFITASLLSFGQNCDGPVNDLIISTGYNPITSTTLGNYAFDPMWRLIQAPADPPGWSANIGGPAIVVPLTSPWNLAGPNSTYINAYPTAQALTDNWNTGTTPYIFEREFCVCLNGGTVADVTFDLNLNADNWAEVYLEDELGNQTLLLSQNYQYVTSNFTGAPAASANVTLQLTGGNYKLKLYHRNKLVIMGANLDGKIYSTALLSDNTCTKRGSIAGYSRIDQNQSGTVDPSDPKAQGWLMRLYDQNNNLVSTMTTDHSGYYFFMDLDPGTYTVTAEGPSGWSVISPITATMTVNVDINVVDVAEFLVIPEENPDQNPILEPINTDDCDVFVPNVFTPDGDQINEMIYFKSNCTGELEATIYNRWGQVVFSTTDEEEGWNGTDRSGNVVAEGTYIYTVTLQLEDDTEIKKTGHITVIR
jgi:gliding motility-associated-like protein